MLLKHNLFFPLDRKVKNRVREKCHIELETFLIESLLWKYFKGKESTLLIHEGQVVIREHAILLTWPGDTTAGNLAKLDCFGC